MRQVCQHRLPRRRELEVGEPITRHQGLHDLPLAVSGVGFRHRRRFGLRRWYDSRRTLSYRGDSGPYDLGTSADL